MRTYGSTKRENTASGSSSESKAETSQRKRRVPLLPWGVQCSLACFTVFTLLAAYSVYMDKLPKHLKVSIASEEPTIIKGSNDPMIIRGSPEPVPLTSEGLVPRWGVAGLGRIAHEFCVALKVAEMPITAVAAGTLPRQKDRAEIFGAQFDADRMYGSYLELAKDPHVDIVYVATTNQLHRNVSMLMMNHGKHVLVEKPTAMNVQEAKEMTECARKNGVFFATNYWNSAFPAIRFARNSIREGMIGNLVSITGDMGFQAVRNYRDRWYSSDLGGGALMDMGCYLLQYLVMMTREATSASLSRNHTGIALESVYGKVDKESGVDIDTSYIMEYHGVVGRFGNSLIRASPFNVQILGTSGAIEIGSPGNCPTTAVLTSFQDASLSSFPPFPCCQQPLMTQKIFEEPLPPYPREYFPQQYPRGTGFVYMIHAIVECLRIGCQELPDVPHREALAVQAALDDLRKGVGAKVL